MDQDELKDELAADMIEVLTSFCARLYGKRSAKNKAKKAMDCIQNQKLAKLTAMILNPMLCKPFF